MHRLFLGFGLLIASFLTSCHVENENAPVRFGQLYLDRLTEQNVSERNFPEISYKKLFTSPDDKTDIFLYNPGILLVDSQGNIYVADWAINKVQKFSPSGEHMTTYGNSGDGTGPGELLSITDFGIAGDTTAYVVDSYGLKVVFFSIEGNFLYQNREKHQPERYRKTGTGREYITLATVPPLLQYRSDENTEIISSTDLVDGRETDLMGLGSEIETHNENILVRLSQYPLILQYAPDGTLVYARTTIGYDGDFTEPEMEILTVGGMPATRNVGRYFHTGPLTIENGKIFVAGVSPSEVPDEVVIDVYDLRTGDYQYSMLLPEKGRFSDAVYRNERIHLSKDSTVVVWEVQG